MESDVFEAKNDSDKWVEEEFNAVEKQINKNIAEYRLDFAMNEIYEFFWGKFCDRYIEECKASGETANLHPMLKKILKLMHPFAPFITEEINELIFKDGSLMDPNAMVDPNTGAPMNSSMDLGQPINEPDLESQGSATEAPEGGEI